MRTKGLYSSVNIVRMNKSLRKRWAGNIARIGKLRNTCVDERIILKWGVKETIC
jgi:hypothetical protein